MAEEMDDADRENHQYVGQARIKIDDIVFEAWREASKEDLSDAEYMVRT